MALRSQPSPSTRRSAPTIDPERVDGDVAHERDAHGGHEHSEDQGGGACAEEGGAPASTDPGRHHDGEGLDHLDQAGAEDGDDEDEGGRGVHGDRGGNYRVSPVRPDRQGRASLRLRDQGIFAREGGRNG